MCAHAVPGVPTVPHEKGDAEDEWREQMPTDLVYEPDGLSI